MALTWFVPIWGRLSARRPVLPGRSWQSLNSFYSKCNTLPSYAAMVVALSVVALSVVASIYRSGRLSEKSKFNLVDIQTVYLHTAQVVPPRTCRVTSTLSAAQRCKLQHLMLCWTSSRHVQVGMPSLEFFGAQYFKKILDFNWTLLSSPKFIRQFFTLRMYFCPLHGLQLRAGFV